MFYIYQYRVTVYICGTMCTPDALRGQERASNTLELELQIVVSHHVNAGPLRAQQMFLTADPSLQPLKMFLKIKNISISQFFVIKQICPGQYHSH